MGTHHTSKEQTRSRTNKDGKKYVKHHITGQKNKHLCKRKDKGHRREGHVSRLRDNRWTLHITTWKPYERKIRRGRPARRCREELVEYWKRIVQDRQMWKQHAETFAQSRDTMMMMTYIYIIYMTNDHNTNDHTIYETYSH